MDRIQIAALLHARLVEAREEAAASYAASKDDIGYFVIDDLLPRDLAENIGARFPAVDAMTQKRSLRERKSVSAQMNRHDPLVEEAVYAFQTPEVVSLIADICGTPSVVPDPFLYAGGISAMVQGDFLNPHLDNSHDKDRARWRALNLLYYVTPDWHGGCGGNLELWPDGVGAAPVVIESRFNRLAVMATHSKSWHSVSPVLHGQRRCVSNYYFTPKPLRADDAFHVTTFRGRPGQKATDAALRVDAFARGIIRKVRPAGIARLTHVNE